MCHRGFDLTHYEFVVEGLWMTFDSTSSLVKTQEYQNASIYLDLSSNSAFSSYKVGFGFRGFIAEKP